jgi:transformation/transcription domain-associated protein
LSIPLLRGLSKLLSLLSTWFNKTLGEKLLDHLQKWTEPHRIAKLRIWSEGEEPMVAAAIVEVCWLLPQASKFVEPIVVTCLKLEGVLSDFKMRQTQSPFREPLARFLNKYPQPTIDFFFQRPKLPLYSELFQSILDRPESLPIREYLCQKQSSLMLLNVCFERPLAIMRSEKSGNSPTGRVSLTLHGIGASNIDAKGPPWPMTTDTHEVQLQGLRALTTLLKYNMSYFKDHGDIIRAMRLLWRSRGRFLRLQNEEQVPPRFHDESNLMASFLMNFATHISSVDIDCFVDVMFELLCIFLQSVTANFSGLRRFLAEMPLSLLTDEKQKYFANKILKSLPLRVTKKPRSSASSYFFCCY